MTGELSMPERNRILRNVVLGVPPKANETPAERQWRQECERDVAKIKQAGHMPEIPFDPEGVVDDDPFERFAEFDPFKHPRLAKGAPGGGRFTAKGDGSTRTVASASGSGKLPTTRQTREALADVGRKLFAAGHDGFWTAVGAVGHFEKKIGVAVWNRVQALPAALRYPALAVGAGLMGTYIAANAAAIRVAEARGGKEHAARVAAITSVVDGIGAKAIPFLMHEYGHASWTVSTAASLIPVGSLGYLALVGGVETLQRAHKLLARVADVADFAETTDDDRAMLFQMLQSAGDRADLLTALIMAALDRTGGELRAAIGLAQQALASGG